MASHSTILAAGLMCLSAAVVVLVPMPWLAAAAAGESSLGREGCETSCGGVGIPFPFGIGPERCMLTPDFEITCLHVGNGVRKAPFLAIFTNVEVLNISLRQGEAKVLNHISSYCYNQVDSGEGWTWNLSNTPYTFSDTANKFTVVGCRALAYIGNTEGNASAMYQTGCVSMCFEDNMDINTCSGMGCCQTAIPKGLKYYFVWFDTRLNMSGVDDDLDPCSFAVLMDSSNYTSSTSSSNNFSLPEFINNNSPSAFNSSRGGMAPMVLDWSIGHDDDDCKTAVRSPGYACVSDHSSCYNAYKCLHIVLI